MNKWRLLLTGFNDAYTNMAIDEAIFIEKFSGNNQPTLRIYGWKPEAISLGYFQRAEEELDLIRCKRENICYVRRITGGGIIFHDKELTYSIVCSKDDLRVKGVRNSFKNLSSFIIDAYKGLGLEASFAKDANLSKRNSGEFSPFCLASNEEYDILIDGRKLGGNAQRRRKDIIFQHGSIPLKLDIAKTLSFLRKSSGNSPEELSSNVRNKVYSLDEALKKELTFNGLKHILIESFRKTFSLDLEESSLTEDEEILTKKLIDDKYSKHEWNLGYGNNIFNSIERKRDDNIYQKACLVK